LLTEVSGHATACHRTADLPSAEAIVPSDGGFSPSLEKLVAAFSGKAQGPRVEVPGMEGLPPSGVGISGALPPTGV
jgi:hypothetical protein